MSSQKRSQLWTDDSLISDFCIDLDGSQQSKSDVLLISWTEFTSWLMVVQEGTVFLNNYCINSLTYTVYTIFAIALVILQLNTTGYLETDHNIQISKILTNGQCFLRLNNVITGVRDQ